jgi:hypothetical protein
MTKQIALDFSDGIFIELTCPKCATKTTVDARSESCRPSSGCNACGTRFDNSATGLVQDLIHIFKVFGGDTPPIKLRLITEVPN